MNEETRQFVEDDEFETLFNQLSRTHKPQKAQLDPKELQSIGLIIAKFQRLEMTIRHFIGILANIANDQTLVNIFTVKSSFKNLLSILSALAVEKRFHRIDDLNKLLQKAYKAEDVRNQIVHSVWTSGPRFKTTISKKKGVVHKSEPYSKGDLQRISDTIDKLDTSIEALCFDYIDDCHHKDKDLKGVRKIRG
jgi:hypothetical protein